MPLKKLSRKKSTKLTSSQSRQAEAKKRPPIVAILGHIDHGKTSLLDKIRQANIAIGESGGITQHIGAYQIKAKESASSMGGREGQGARGITFIDTPGHSAFSKMRSRGARVADLVVLVVAADEGFKPQTKESLKHIESAKVPYLVAINKVDLPNINIGQVKKDLAKNEILVESEGGEIVTVSVSAKTGKGIDELLEMILLLAEMAELKGDPGGELEAVVIESKLDQARGPVATTLIRNGSLRVGDEIKVEKMRAKIRAMFDEKGEKIRFAGPSQPAEILGFNEVPPVGGKVTAAVVTEKPLLSPRPSTPTESKEVSRAGSIPLKTGEEKKLKVIIKADTSGTLEAILGSLPKEVEVVFSDAGEVTESNVLLADTTGAEILAFRVKIPTRVKKLAGQEKVAIRNYAVIYDLLEEIGEKIIKLMEPTIDEEELGRAAIVAEFEVKKRRVAGCRVTEGKIDKKSKVHLKRGEKIISNGWIKSMKQGKEDINQAGKGEEFGAIFSPSLDFKIGDVLVSYRPKGKEN